MNVNYGHVMEDNLYKDSPTPTGIGSQMTQNAGSTVMLFLLFSMILFIGAGEWSRKICFLVGRGKWKFF